MRRTLTPLATAFLVAIAIAVAGGQAGSTLTVNKAPGVIVYDGLNRTKPMGKTASDGSVGLSMDDLNNTRVKPRMALAKQQCDRDTTLHILRADSEDEKKCRRQKEENKDGCGCSVLGYFNWGENKTFGRNLGRELIYVGGGIIGTGIILGTKGGGGTPGSGGTGSGGGTTTGGGSTTPPPTTPTNSPVPINVNITVQSDQFGHDPFVKYGIVKQISKVTLSGNDVRFDGLSPWVPLTGTILNGIISARGTGTVADRAGVLVIFDGSITSANQIAQGLLTIGGPGGTLLPNGPILYRMVTP
jgi:hypothetical protein